jgi:hypothetical protein
MITVFMIFIFARNIFGSQTPLLSFESITYPYVIIAGLLMSTTVFLHVLSIIKIKKIN